MTRIYRRSNSLILCACGCGELIPKYDDKSMERQFKNRTHMENHYKEIEKQKQKISKELLIQCRCGCGEYKKHIDMKGKKYYYIDGHYSRTLEHRLNFEYFDLKEKIKEMKEWLNIGNDIAAKSLYAILIRRLYGYRVRDKCTIDNKWCKSKIIQLFNVNGNIFDLSFENIVPMCRSHIHMMFQNRDKYKTLEDLQHAIPSHMRRTRKGKHEQAVLMSKIGRIGY